MSSFSINNNVAPHRFFHDLPSLFVSFLGKSEHEVSWSHSNPLAGGSSRTLTAHTDQESLADAGARTRVPPVERWRPIPRFI